MCNVLRLYLQFIIVIFASGLGFFDTIGNAAAQTGPTISARDTVANEGGGVANFLVRLSAPSSQTVSLSYYTGNGSATSSDYGYLGTTPLSFAPGETAKIVSISLTDDTTPEGTESFYLKLFGPTNGVIGTGSATATIYDNDGVTGTPVIAISDPVADWSAGTIVFTLSLNRRSTSTVKVNYATQPGTAGSGDFTAKSGTVTFAPGQRVKTVSVALSSYGGAEDIETFSLLLSNPINATLPDNRATARIWSNNQPPAATPSLLTITADDTVANEGDGVANFLVRLSAPSSQTVSLSYYTGNGSATSSDYGYLGTTPLSFAPGETAKIVSISLMDDTTPEGTESFYLKLFGPTNGVIGTGSATATIYDNDGVAGTPAIAISDLVVDEGAGSAVFTLSLNRRSISTVKVNYATQIGSAGTADFTTAAGTVAFSPGQRVKTVAVAMLNDAAVEDIETFDLLLSNPINATLPDNRATARIWSSDLPPLSSPTITADNTFANEGDGAAKFTVHLSSPSSQTISLSYYTGNGSATSSDYGYLGTTPLSFAPGETAKIVSISLMDDTTPESTESFYLKLFGPTNGVIGTGSATATIYDNDGA